MEKIKCVGYVKLAKLWERSEDSAIKYHNEYYKKKIGAFDDCELVGVYIDITGKKEIFNREAMVRLINDCQSGKVDRIYTQTKAYLAANTKEFCYLIKFLFSLSHRIDIITEDDAYNMNTVVNEDEQREALLKMANDYIAMFPQEFQEWLTELVRSLNSIEN